METKAYPGTVSNRRPIYREHFYPVEIINETSRSWIIGHKGCNYELFKVSKSDPFREKNGEYDHRPMLFTDKAVDDECFMEEHKHKISNEMLRNANVKTLRKIAELIGYNTNA